ncbi:MAG: hypothetical protein KC729_14225, partial [Candidatus Eisenbacteria bacterium]|nr:hypothetical protein [Candidatus Eisenbacteria bacterium]
MTLVGIVAPTRATAQTASEPAAAEPASYPTERIAPPARQIYPIIGARWFLPTDTAIRDLYGSGPGLGIGVGVHVRRRLAIEAQLEWYRSTAHPIGPAFVNGSESTLTLLPVSTMLRYRFSEGPAAVLFSIGPALLFQLESFDYRLLGE